MLAASATATLALPAGPLLAARSAIFNRPVALAAYREHARLPPDGWVRQESPAALEPARRALLDRLPSLEAWLSAPRATAPEEATALLAMLRPTPMVCSRRRDLLDKTVELLGGGGTACCSDFVEVFQLLASLRGVATREVATARHNYVEYWDTARGAWSLVDPTFGVMATGPAGSAVGALALALAPSAASVTCGRSEPGRRPRGQPPTRRATRSAPWS